MRTINLSKLQHFVKHGLKDKLRDDLRDLRILKEADVECCAYYHLRRFLKRDRTWHVFARKHSPNTGFYTDLIIFHNQKAKIAIELKWRQDRISRKDRRALASTIGNLGVRKTYFYCVMPDISKYEKLPSKRSDEKYRFFERPVDLGYKSERRRDEFLRQRRSLRKN